MKKSKITQIGLLLVLLVVTRADEKRSKARGTRRALDLAGLDLTSVVASQASEGLDLTPVLGSQGTLGSPLNVLQESEGLGNLLMELGKKSGKSGSFNGNTDDCLVCDKGSKVKPTSLRFRYNSNGQNSFYQDSSKATCRAGSYPSATTVSVNGRSFSVSDGTEFVVDNISGATTQFTIGGQSCTVHTSCSAPIVDGDQIGPFVVIGANGRQEPGLNYCCNKSCSPPSPPTPPPIPRTSKPTWPPTRPPTRPPTDFPTPDDVPTPTVQTPPPTRPPTPAPTPVQTEPPEMCLPRDEPCPIVPPLQDDCNFFGNEATPPLGWLSIILQIANPPVQPIPVAGCRYPSLTNPGITIFCICAQNFDVLPECGTAICLPDQIVAPTTPPTAPPPTPVPTRDPVCPPEEPELGGPCNYGGTCVYDQCHVQREDGSFPTVEKRCVCFEGEKESVSMCQIYNCPEHPCPTVYSEDFEKKPNTSEDWKLSDGRQVPVTYTAKTGGFMGPFGEANEAPLCKMFDFSDEGSGGAIFSYDLSQQSCSDDSRQNFGLLLRDKNGEEERFDAPLLQTDFVQATGGGFVWRGGYSADQSYDFELTIPRDYLYQSDYRIEICFNWDLQNCFIGIDNIDTKFCEDDCPPEPCCPIDKPNNFSMCELPDNVMCAYDECPIGDPGRYQTRCECKEGKYVCRDFTKFGSCLVTSASPTPAPIAITASPTPAPIPITASPTPAPIPITAPPTPAPIPRPPTPVVPGNCPDSIENGDQCAPADDRPFICFIVEDGIEIPCLCQANAFVCGGGTRAQSTASQCGVSRIPPNTRCSSEGEMCMSGGQFCECNNGYYSCVG